jgi:ketosteroid isomerase-like protein
MSEPRAESGSMSLTIADATNWAERYFDAWKTNDRAMVESLFSDDAVYFYGPFRPPAVGRDAIVSRWIANAQADVRSQFEVVAVAGRAAVIHWHVAFGQTELDGVLIVRFDAEGRCCDHREWYAEKIVTPTP